MHKLIIVLFLWTTSLYTTAVYAADVMLTVSGKIKKHTDPKNKVYLFSEKDIFSMPKYEIYTSTAWTKKSKFVGVRVEDILERVGAYGKAIKLRALDDFFVTMPISVPLKYHTILAYSMNGKRLVVSDFGPLWSIFPRDDYPNDFKNSSNDFRYIRQIYEIEVE